MVTSEEARAVRDAKLHTLHEQLAGAVESLVSGEDWKQALEFAARFRARSFNNTLLIFAQHQAACPSRYRHLWRGSSSGRRSAGKSRRGSRGT